MRAIIAVFTCVEAHSHCPTFRCRTAHRPSYPLTSNSFSYKKTSPGRQFPCPFQVESPQRVLGRRDETFTRRRARVSRRTVPVMSNMPGVRCGKNHHEDKVSRPALQARLGRHLGTITNTNASTHTNTNRRCTSKNNRITNTNRNA